MIGLFRRKKKLVDLVKPIPTKSPPATVDPLRPPKSIPSDGWVLIHHGGPPYGYSTEYYANEVPLDEHHTIVRLVPHSACNHEYRKIPNHGVAKLVKFDPPTYDKVTIEFVRHNHSNLWECGLQDP